MAAISSRERPVARAMTSEEVPKERIRLAAQSNLTY